MTVLGGVDFLGNHLAGQLEFPFYKDLPYVGRFTYEISFQKPEGIYWVMDPKPLGKQLSIDFYPNQK